ncbi:uncharacterized protein LOC110226932 [Arabidopsis lyrata subsp. lyrata]|uniref:uncharacterized protein LOC110226932 n=1 Tax=Arabidopsis lyrata subsp. lyrata TaxID=81972 RepID=UPI000A29E3B9|nr:uncharacterized protein LOC110226932 [Arabidopsis lyrata subsp. lyrata]XP_020875557.1 uncharacterized protein LOC110226932 [Arabidopsis lyrata subsp. lyrata]|eukprot:XP_020875554.1 uncharacterized protein LOC110226932 [Arabidopsis lyrata subsp. lyrata]
MLRETVVTNGIRAEVKVKPVLTRKAKSENISNNNNSLKKFRTTRCPKEFKNDLAVHYLRGEADHWWRNVKRSLPIGFVSTWEDFLREFNNKYFSQEAMDQLDHEFLELRQGTMSIREYEAVFTRLRRFCVRNFGEQDMMRRFMRGLRADIRNRSSIRAYTSLVELVEEIAMMERGLEEEAKDLKRAQGKGNKASRVSET